MHSLNVGLVYNQKTINSQLHLTASVSGSGVRHDTDSIKHKDGDTSLQAHVQRCSAVGRMDRWRRRAIGRDVEVVPQAIAQDVLLAAKPKAVSSRQAPSAVTDQPRPPFTKQENVSIAMCYMYRSRFQRRPGTLRQTEHVRRNGTTNPCLANAVCAICRTRCAAFRTADDRVTSGTPRNARPPWRPSDPAPRPEAP